MHHRLLLQTPTLSVEYDVIDDFIRATWAPDQTVDTIRSGHELLLGKLQRVHCHRLLDDHRHIHGLWADLADWVATDWYPRARAAGLTVHAVIYATDFYGRRSTELALQRVGGGLIAGFDSEEAAIRALLEL